VSSFAECHLGHVSCAVLATLILTSVRIFGTPRLGPPTRSRAPNARLPGVLFPGKISRQWPVKMATNFYSSGRQISEFFW
jgi:hypothetical protein